MAKEHVFGLFLGLLSCIGLQACSIPPNVSDGDRQTAGHRSDDRSRVVGAKPLPPPLPQKVALNATAAPWIKTEFLETLGTDATTQGLWVQSETQAFAAHQESIPLSAASVTKVATSLAALHRLGPGFRFVTKFGYLGSISNGTLQGDLIVTGGDDPLFVWEDVFAIANLLESLGIKQITGDLIIQTPFVMNFESEAQLSGTLLRQGLDAKLWPPEAIAEFNRLPAGSPKPNIAIQGDLQFVSQAPAATRWLVQHESLPLIELLKRMNRYSNNPMADQIANYIGGASTVREVVRSLTGLSPQDVNFINGSGLGPENRITPQGATLMLHALSNLLQEKGMSLGDVLTIVGQDEGILDPRPLPEGLVVKSGTLNQVSALAGVLPTQSQGLVWFTMLNNQGDVETFRQTQEKTLQKMVAEWGAAEGETLLTPTLDSAQLQPINRRL